MTQLYCHGTRFVEEFLLGCFGTRFLRRRSVATKSTVHIIRLLDLKHRKTPVSGSRVSVCDVDVLARPWFHSPVHHKVQTGEAWLQPKGDLNRLYTSLRSRRDLSRLL